MPIEKLKGVVALLLIAAATNGFAKEGNLHPACLCSRSVDFEGKHVAITSTVFVTRESLDLLEKSNQSCGISLSISDRALKNPSVENFVRRAYSGRPIKFGWVGLVGTFRGTYKIDPSDGSRVLILDDV